MNLVEVAVDAPIYPALTYIWDQEGIPERGLSVEVPLGSRKAKGLIINPSADADADSTNFKLKKVSGLIAYRPQLSNSFLKWLEWMADYYVYPLGRVTSLAFPPLKPSTGKRNATRKKDVVKTVKADSPPVLTDEQKSCLDAIGELDAFQAHLVHGVTGSGKTEIYLHLLEKCLAQGKQGLVLVPEIALTPQLVNRFSARFGDQIAVIHSQLTERERTNQWWSVHSGEKKILIGARSALFCPITNLGLIVVDEEHESSYKQEEKLKYHARDAAVVLAKLTDCPIVLGSATPSLETWQNTQSGKYKLHVLKNRVSNRPLPKIEVVDLRQERHDRKANVSTGPNDLPFWMSEKLFESLTACFERKEQSALFLNRRGIAQTVLCQECGYVYECPNCAISLTLHGKRNLVCHYCDYAQLLTDQCTNCPDGEPTSIGLGTEQIEDDLNKMFPEARVLRADRDEISSREDMESMVEKMENHELDILVGTQMIAKGLDFEKLTMVGLVLADVGFNMPDFRSVEKSFQLLTQVSGRSGRHVEHGGEVIIQTYNPDYQALEFALSGDFTAFARSELEVRNQLSYSPFGRLAGLRISGTKLDQVKNTAERLRSRSEKLKESSEHYADVQILGPTEAPLAKLRGKFRYHLLLKSRTPNRLSAFCRQVLGDSRWITSGTKVQVDIDPMSLM